MKRFIRQSLLATAAICSMTLMSLSPVSAADDTAMVQNAQMRLASLGYYVGRYDGVMGTVTHTALADFQRNNGLSPSGELTAETYNLLGQREYMAGYAAPRYAYADSRYVYADAAYYGAPVVEWDHRWYNVHTQSLPARFGALDVTEEDRAGLRHYTVSWNGQPVILAKNQPSVLRASQTFRLNGEDAVIFTAYNDDGVCSYKSYLLTMHNDGTHDAAREINNCSNNYEAHVSDGALLISFSGRYSLNDGWTTWDTWRYEGGSLVRI